MSVRSLDLAVRVPEDVIFRELDGEAVILNLDTGMYFGVDAVGTRMWQLLEARASLREVWVALQAEYDAAPDRLERDLLDFVDGLCAKGLVTTA
ncbi:MAG: PqqD family protein [Vicinamibacterales bacterium]